MSAEKRNKVEIALEKYKMDLQVEAEKEELEQMEINRKESTEFEAHFKKVFNNYFIDICTFEDFEQLMNRRGSVIRFEYDSDEMQKFMRKVVFSDMPKEREESAQTITMGVERADLGFWNFGKYRFKEIQFEEPIRVLNWLVDTIGFVKKSEDLETQPESPPQPNALIHNVAATEITLLDHFAGVALPLVINLNHTQKQDAENAYEYAAAMIEARQKYF